MAILNRAKLRYMIYVVETDQKFITGVLCEATPNGLKISLDLKSGEKDRLVNMPFGYINWGWYRLSNWSIRWG